ncbi:hypothetical protein [Streptomyces sp. CC224B]|nr:hypothetical protein [Streptomyces sp. CC224B]
MANPHSSTAAEATPQYALADSGRLVQLGGPVDDLQLAGCVKLSLQD